MNMTRWRELDLEINKIEAAIEKEKDSKAKTKLEDDALVPARRALYQHIENKKITSHAVADNAVRQLGYDAITFRQKILQQNGAVQADDKGALVGLMNRHDALHAQSLTFGEKNDLDIAFKHLQGVARGIPLTPEQLQNPFGNGTINELSWQLWQLSEKVKRTAIFGNENDWLSANLEELEDIKLRWDELSKDMKYLTERQKEAANMVWNQYARVHASAYGQLGAGFVSEDDYKNVGAILARAPSGAERKDEHKVKRAGLDDGQKPVGLDGWSGGGDKPSLLMAQHRTAAQETFGVGHNAPGPEVPSPRPAGGVKPV
jgi:hypothetical protein